MQKLGLYLCLLFCLVKVQGQTPSATLQSPEHFLGYPLGAHFTPHYKIVRYFESVASALPGQVHIQYYGQTNEGRPLMVAFIGSEANIARLEDIRKNNLRLAGMLTDQAGSEAGPVLVWLSYNVHGNEPSSSEASMRTLYALVDPSNTQSKDWLKNTVVIIDPCLNPDGRDRYVNWFNDVVSTPPNPDPDSREHQEPWPGGRTNHYNFDLNRDWFWQTQTESKARLALYDQWLPQIHVDYHEQGFNAPYYFAPAAEPYNEIVTPWQRSFQVAIGKNNAKYFDANGWLFFTKQEFDLLYPSYGDTYPLFNGSIGMTYEQGGHSMGGLAVQQDNGDTLTLTDRITHHFTTGMSTIETASKNATDLLHAFHAYFVSNANEGSGPYQAYVVRVDSADLYKANALKGLLQRNGIRFGTASGTIRGWDYLSRAEEGYTLHATDLVIPSHQPKATLVKTLFEPSVKMTDSMTYDITAWSLPYAYGLRAYAVKTPLAVSLGAALDISSPAFDASGASYGYLIPWNGLNSAKALTYLYQHHIKVRINQQPFEEGGRSFKAGSLLVLATGNSTQKETLPAVMKALQQACDVPIIPLGSGFVDKGFDLGSSYVRPAKAPKIALVTGSSVSSSDAGEVWFLFEQELHYPITQIQSSEFTSLRLSNYDVIILPDGYYSWLTDKKETEALHNWMNQGGRLIAMAGAVGQFAGDDWGVKVKKSPEEEAKKSDDTKADPYVLLKHYGDRDRDDIRGSVPGAIYKVEMDSTHPLAFGFPSYYYTLRQDQQVYQFLESGWNVGVIKKNGYISGFVGSKAKQHMEDGLLFGVEDMGNGNLILLADNPLFRDFWENGKLLFCNAVFMVGN